jgi:hypothetical protein
VNADLLGHYTVLRCLYCLKVFSWGGGAGEVSPTVWQLLVMDARSQPVFMHMTKKALAPVPYRIFHLF